MSLTLEQILAADDRSVEKVPCPEWGGDVYVCTLTADERDAWEKDAASGKPTRASLVGRALCDKDGNRLNPTEAQVAALGKKASGPMERCVDAIMELNAMRKQDVEEMEKNYEATAESA